MIGKPGERLVCYCPPGVCQAPRGFSGPCNRASMTEADILSIADRHGQRWTAPDEEGISFEKSAFFDFCTDVLRAAGGQEPRKPDGYAYEYWDGIRFNGGGEVNGGKPIRSIPYWLDTPPADGAPLTDQRIIDIIKACPNEGAELLFSCPDNMLVGDFARLTIRWARAIIDAAAAKEQP